MAARTSRIALGPGVTHPIVRHPSLIAAAIATLAELAPGRVHLGMGIGDSGPANMGLPRASLAQLEAAVRDVRALLGGETVDSDGTPLRLAYVKGPAAPIYVAAASDRTHRASGRFADGALVAGAIDELTTSIEAIRTGEHDAGRPSGATDVVLFTTACLNDDLEVAREAVRPVVARKAILSLGRRARLGTLDPADQEPLERLRHAYDTHHHMEALYNDLVPERWIDRFTMAGSPEHVLTRCRQVAADGAQQIAIVFAGPDPEVQMQRFSESVIRPLRTRRTS
jgi:5,10-methylenetetrahydromethanopterin reductase